MDRFSHHVDWTDQLTSLYAESKSVHQALNEVRLQRAEYRNITDKLADRVDRNAEKHDEALKAMKDDIKNVISLLEKLTSKLNDGTLPSVMSVPVDPVSSTPFVSFVGAEATPQHTARNPAPSAGRFRLPTA